MFKNITLTFTLIALQIAYTNTTFTADKRVQYNGNQQQIQQQQNHNSDQSTTSDQDNNGLHGMITNASTNEPQTQQVQDQDTDSDAKVDTKADDDTQVHMCIPHKGHDPCTDPNGCLCPGYLAGRPCYRPCLGRAHTFNLEESQTCIICGKSAKKKSE